MSDGQVIAFQAKVAEDQGLQDVIQQMGLDVDGIVALGRREGFAFTRAELDAYMQSMEPESGRELSDEELESVAAGGNWTDPGHCSTP